MNLWSLIFHPTFSFADMALRLIVYLQTDYALELERRNSFQMKEKSPPEMFQEKSSAIEQNSEEPSMVC